jgi:hypothetical protein
MFDPTCDYCRLLVRALAHICIVGLPYLPYIYRGGGKSIIIFIISHYAYHSCVRDVIKLITLVILSISLRSSFVLGLSLLELLGFLDLLGAS